MLEKNDHRVIARKLDLLHFHDEAPGMVFWHPRGLALYRELEDAQRAHVRREGYEEVRSPQVMRRAMWEASGHWQHFQDGMMRMRKHGEIESALEPVSCPGHAQIVRRMGAQSYRDLPIRLAELAIVHRDEASGALHGLMRLRQFSQDSGHVFCAAAQVEDEVVRFLEGVRPFYAAFGVRDLDVALSLRPADREGEDAAWDRAEALLARALDRRGEAYRVQPGAGAFYGPTIEIALRDLAGRAWQCGTIQMDLVMPARFGLVYVASSGEKQPLVMLHRALYGSLERFLGIVLEQYGVALPGWLAPEQVTIISVSPDQHDAASARARELRADGVRVSLDTRKHRLGKRIAEARHRGVPFVAVVGACEAERGEVSLRSRVPGGHADAQRVLPVAEARALLREALARPDEVRA